MSGGHRTRQRRGSRRGVFTFEWILIVALLAIGLVGGVAAIRTAMLGEYREIINCMARINVCECATCDDGFCFEDPPADCEDSWWQ